jgi:hypothetical protein
MLTEQDVFKADSQDIKEDVDEVKEDYNSYTSKSLQLFIAGLILNAVLFFSAGCVVAMWLHECLPCVGG